MNSLPTRPQCRWTDCLFTTAHKGVIQIARHSRPTFSAFLWLQCVISKFTVLFVMVMKNCVVYVSILNYFNNFSISSIFWIFYCIFSNKNISTQQMKWNEMNRALGHLCAHIGYTRPREPPEDGEMNEMTLSSRHQTRNSSPGGLRPSTLSLGHGGSPQYWVSHVDGEETFLLLSNRRDREPNPEL